MPAAMLLTAPGRGCSARWVLAAPAKAQGQCGREGNTGNRAAWAGPCVGHSQAQPASAGSCSGGCQGPLPRPSCQHPAPWRCHCRRTRGLAGDRSPGAAGTAALCGGCRPRAGGKGWCRGTLARASQEVDWAAWLPRGADGPVISSPASPLLSLGHPSSLAPHRRGAAALAAAGKPVLPALGHTGLVAGGRGPWLQGLIVAIVSAGSYISSFIPSLYIFQNDINSPL